MNIFSNIKAIEKYGIIGAKLELFCDYLHIASQHAQVPHHISEYDETNIRIDNGEIFIDDEKEFFGYKPEKLTSAEYNYIIDYFLDSLGIKTIEDFGQYIIKKREEALKNLDERTLLYRDFEEDSLIDKLVHEDLKYNNHNEGYKYDFLYGRFQNKSIITDYEHKTFKII